MTYDDVKSLFDYHYWARDRTLDALDALTPDEFTRDLGNSFRSIRDSIVSPVNCNSISSPLNHSSSRDL